VDTVEFQCPYMQHCTTQSGPAWRTSTYKQATHCFVWTCSTAARMAAAAAAMGDAGEARFWRGLPATLAALRAALPKQAPPPAPADLAAGVAAAFSSGRSGSGSNPNLPPRSTGEGQEGGANPNPNPKSKPPRRASSDTFATRAYIAGDPRAMLPVAATGRRGSRGGAADGGGGSGEMEEAAAGMGPLWSERLALAEARERVAWHEAMARGSGASAEHLQVSPLLL